MAKSKQEILDEYRAAAGSKNEHEMHGWRTENTWLNRFDILSSLVIWPKVKSWVDVGCGTAKFFDVVSKKGITFSSLWGIDALDEYLAIARARSWENADGITFLKQDIEFIERDISQKFDLVTSVGVIYQCGIQPEIFIRNIKSLVSPDGTLIITTENPDFHLWPIELKHEYPSIDKILAALNKGSKPSSIDVFFGNPLDNTLERVEAGKAKKKFKELYFIVRF